MIRIVKWTGHVACMGEMMNPYGILIGKSNRNIIPGRPWHRWENIKIEDY
jgi:hypothetical protein